MSPSLDPLAPPTRDALLAAAVPGWFNASVLGDLLADPGRGPAALAEVCATPYVEPAEFPDTYRLDPIVRDELLAILEHEHPAHYQALLQQAHAGFVDRALQSDGPAQAACRDEAMVCVEQLFFVSLALQRAGELAPVLDRSRRLPNLTRPQTQRLDYYAAVMHGELYRYEQAHALFESLLEQPDLQERLRARVLNSAGIFSRRQGLYDQAITYLEQARQTAHVGFKVKLGTIRHLRKSDVTRLRLWVHSKMAT